MINNLENNMHKLNEDVLQVNPKPTTTYFPTYYIVSHIYGNKDLTHENCRKTNKIIERQGTETSRKRSDKRNVTEKLRTYYETPV